MNGNQERGVCNKRMRGKIHIGTHIGIHIAIHIGPIGLIINNKCKWYNQEI